MRVAFYAPLKAPTHPRPSGDRTVARLLLQALGRAGFEVELASTFRSRDGAGDAHRQQRIQQVGTALAARWLRRSARRDARARPALWFTYHLYHKAPDWLGPVASRALGIPYVVAEASFAPKQAGGPWDLGHRATAAALARAAAVFSPNPADDACIAPLLAGGAGPHRLAPFLDLDALPPMPPRPAARAGLAAATGLDPALPWLGCVAMMRDGAKLASYRLLAEALARLPSPLPALLVAGDGVARADVEKAFAAVPGLPVCFLGECDAARLATLWAAADLCAWPAVGEAYGMALLEAQVRGVPVVAGRSGGVPGIVRHGETGLLVAPGDADAFAGGLSALLGDAAQREAMARAARDGARARHHIDAAAAALRRTLEPLVAAAGPSAREQP